MKRLISGLLIFIMMASGALALSACKKSDDTQGANETEEAAAEPEETAETAEPEDEEEAEPAPAFSAEDVVKSFEPDAEDVIEHDLPMQIESVTLLKDGSIVIVPTDDLQKNELGDSKATSLMPFAESGVAEDIYLLRVGNGGYRTVAALMDDGTISAINTRALIEDHIIAVIDTLGGRDSFTSLEQTESEDGFGVIGKTEEGDDVVLDPVLLVGAEDVQPAE